MSQQTNLPKDFYLQHSSCCCCYVLMSSFQQRMHLIVSFAFSRCGVIDHCVSETNSCDVGLAVNDFCSSWDIFIWLLINWQPPRENEDTNSNNAWWTKHIISALPVVTGNRRRAQFHPDIYVPSNHWMGCKSGNQQIKLTGAYKRL